MDDDNNNSFKTLREAALHFHKHPKPGKLAINSTKPLGNQRDLSLAYSPGVAAPCQEISRDPRLVHDYTIKSNLVAVITNGTAVLGLGNIGALAAKPVMEGKAVLFKQFAGIDVFDLEINETDIDRFVDIVASLEPTFGGINLEDIKAPECFAIEEKLRQKMNIPVFHDDQHGTAIIVAAAITNALTIADKKLDQIKIVTSGAGAAAMACIDLLVDMGAKVENIWLTDSNGLVYKGRCEDMTDNKELYAKDTDSRSLGDVIDDADIFLGLSVGDVLKPDMVRRMAKMPIIMALANPYPEIMPEEAHAVRDDIMICTGRSDYPNQVNNVLCFPYIFRGALDVGATTINRAMKQAAVKAISDLAREAVSESVGFAYGEGGQRFGRDYLIPSTFDRRLILYIAPAVAEAAMSSGIATRPIDDMPAYLERLNRFVFRTGLIMKPVVAEAKKNQSMIAFADGEDERVLRASQDLLDEQVAKVLLIGRPNVIGMRVKRAGLRQNLLDQCTIINPEDDPRYREYVDCYLSYTARKGVSPTSARTIIRTNTTAIGSVAVVRGEADALICGVEEGLFAKNLSEIDNVIGLEPGVDDYSTLNMLVYNKGTIFICDGHVSLNPSAEQVAQMTKLSASHIRRFGIEPKVALLSHSSYGTLTDVSAVKMRQALEILRSEQVDFEVDGEMQGHLALDPEHRAARMPNSYLGDSSANTLIFPNIEAANISLNLLKVTTNGLLIGPILLGANKPAHILTSSVTVRGIFNMASLASAEAKSGKE